MNSSSFEADFAVAARIAHVTPVKGLREKVDPRHTALLVIDMQNDFIADEGLIAREGRDVSQAKEMAKHLPTLIKTAREAGVFVVFVRNVYTSEQNFYLSDVWLEQAARKRAGGYTRIPVCAAGSWGGDFYGDVRPEPHDPIVTKHRYSAFYNTDLDTSCLQEWSLTFASKPAPARLSFVTIMSWSSTTARRPTYKRTMT
jgi:isochorismate hydrolase